MVCGIPLDAEYFDVSGFAGDDEAVDKFLDFGLQLPGPLPRRGEQECLLAFNSTRSIAVCSPTLHNTRTSTPGERADSHARLRMGHRAKWQAGLPLYTVRADCQPHGATTASPLPCGPKKTLGWNSC